MTIHPPRLVVLTREIAAYHDARFAALGRRLGQLEVLAVADEGSFAGFLAERASPGYRAERLYPDLASYRAAAESGALQLRITETLDRIAPDVVAIAGWASPESYAALQWAKACGRRVIVMSDSQAHDASRQRWREALKARVLRYCDAALVAGRTHRAYLEQLGFAGTRVVTGYDVIDNTYFAEGARAARADAPRLRAELRLPTRYIMATGRFVAKKNFVRLVEAFGRARAESGQEIGLLIVGDGDERSAIIAAIHGLGLADHVYLPGFQGYDAMPVLYGLAEGFAHVALTEQWGLVVNEAAAAGLPLVLSSTIGAAPELLVPGQNGWLCTPGDTGSIAAALTVLMRLAPETRMAMGARSRAIVADWGPERFSDGMIAAAAIARTVPLLRPGLADRMLLRRIGQRPVETVA